MIRLKNAKEIDGIRKSCHLLADLFNEIIPKVKPGVTTKQIDDWCVEFMHRFGGKPAWYQEGFPGAACISINEEVIHGIPSKKRIVHDGDLVSLDIGINLGGYISDSTHTVMVGSVKSEHRKLVKVTRESLNAGIFACTAGHRINDITNAVYEIAHEQNGYGVHRVYANATLATKSKLDPADPYIYVNGKKGAIYDAVCGDEIEIRFTTAPGESVQTVSFVRSGSGLELKSVSVDPLTRKRTFVYTFTMGREDTELLVALGWPGGVSGYEAKFAAPVVNFAYNRYIGK